MRALRSRSVGTLPPWLLLQVHCPYPPLVQSQGADPFCSDVLGSTVRHRAQMAVEGAVGLNMAGQERPLSFPPLGSIVLLEYAQRKSPP
ncbi:hypothetical protein B296_00028200 [Ensete ventricosum]|uniref:Uncharacterized protein n=1 Tax=Ensete ventricosum TaxID=4639 RepID=A0A426ZJ67_ENSVE|nr:hypothetical protein B296_00028200 [Ensete ventricosum]